MMKAINVEVHVNKYSDVDISYIAALVKGLNTLIDQKRAAKIEALQSEIEMLNAGEVKPAEVKPASERKPRKKKTEGQDLTADL